MATSLGLLRNLCRFYNPHIYIYQFWNVGKVWSSSCWDIQRYRPFRSSRSTIFIFYPILTQKLLNRFSPFFTRCRAIGVAISAFIRKTIVHLVLKCQCAECRSFHKFCPKLVAMATSLEISKNRSRSIIWPKTLSFREKIAKIGPTDPECHYAKWTNIVQFRQTFHFLSRFISKTTEPIFTIFYVI